MPRPSLPRIGAGCLLAALTWAGATHAAAPGDDGAPVHGLIVRLKQAPAHERLAARAGAPAAERAQVRALVEREALRWQRLTDESGLGGTSGRRGPTLRPVGRDQRLLSFERPMARAQAQALMTRIAAHPQVEWVEPNTRERRLQLPDDPYFSDGSQWWLRPVSGANGNALADRRRGVPGFQSAWLLPGGTGGPAGVIAVLDTGITDHPDLAGRLLPGYDFVSDLKFGNDGDGRDADPSDPGDFVSAADLADSHYGGCALASSSWHGTVIAGLTAAATNNGLGVAGINWNGRVLPVRVAGKCGADVADIVDGLRWAAGLPVAGVPLNPHPARIVNISFGGSSPCGAAYQTAIDELKAVGAVVVAAVGNEHASPTRPANCSGTIGVVGLNRDGFKTHYSNFGAGLAASGIATVAGDDAADPSARWNVLADDGIRTVYNAGSAGPGAAGYANYWGTSFAAPLVSGTLSLMLGVNPALTYDQLLDGLRRSARPHVTSPSMAPCSDGNPGRCLCTAQTCGPGILDAEQALLYAADPAAYSAPARSPAVIDTDELRRVAALGPDRDPNPAPPAAVVTGGGGAVSPAWLAALGLAAAALGSARRPRRRR